MRDFTFLFGIFFCLFVWEDHVKLSIDKSARGYTLSLMSMRSLQKGVVWSRTFSQLMPASSTVLHRQSTEGKTIMQNISEIWNGFLLAVPKKRRSIAKRRWLRKFKALKPRDDIEDCVVCGGKKLRGKLCHHCFQWTMSLTEKAWQKQKDEGTLRKGRFVK